MTKTISSTTPSTKGHGTSARIVLTEMRRVQEGERAAECVICGKDLKPGRVHVDTRGEVCFKKLLKKQRARL